ncbi:MAG TPA: hypothetical protein EYG68_10355 [Leucothrix mucor]|nr:hypothetical protein [Leucothrix mucor]
MKKILISTISVVSIFLLSESILAAGSSVKARLQSQELRIQKGCDRGQITNNEELLLRREHKKIKAMVERLMRNRPVSVKSKKKVHVALNRASVHIFKKRYNKQSKRRGRSK